jgi:hypothetical protein
VIRPSIASNSIGGGRLVHSESVLSDRVTSMRDSPELIGSCNNGATLSN